MSSATASKGPRILASITRRLCAKTIDCALAGILFIAVRFAIDVVAGYVPIESPRAGLLAAVLLSVGYLLLADALPGGQSLGKRLLRILVIDRKSGRPCSLSQAFTRNASFFVIFDWMWIFMESRSRLGDMYASTVVLQAERLKG